MVNIISSFFTQAFFGVELWRYIIFIAIIFLAFLLGKILYKLAKTIGRKITERSKSKIDDLILDILEEPIVFIVFIIGLNCGFTFLGITDAAIVSLFGNIVFVLIILAVAYTAIKSVNHILEKLIHPIVAKTDTQLDDHLMPILSKVLKIVIVIFTMLAIISHLGYDVTAILAGLGIGGIALAFAAQSTIADVFGGFSIFTSQPFVRGDQIKFDGIQGTVEEVGLRMTHIRDLDGRMVTVPNSKVATAAIINISSEPARKIVLKLGLTYDTSSEKLNEVQKILSDIFSSNKKIQNNFVIYFKNFGEFFLDMESTYWVEEREIANINKVINEVNMEIKKRFEKAKIEFAFPTQTIYSKKS